MKVDNSLINEIITEKTDDYGQVILDLSELDNGDYTVQGWFDGDEYYEKSYLEDYDSISFKFIKYYVTRYKLDLYDINGEVERTFYSSNLENHNYYTIDKWFNSCDSFTVDENNVITISCDEFSDDKKIILNNLFTNDLKLSFSVKGNLKIGLVSKDLDKNNLYEFSNNNFKNFEIERINNNITIKEDNVSKTWDLNEITNEDCYLMFSPYDETENIGYIKNVNFNQCNTIKGKLKSTENIKQYTNEPINIIGRYYNGKKVRIYLQKNETENYDSIDDEDDTWSNLPINYGTISINNVVQVYNNTNYFEYILNDKNVGEYNIVCEYLGDKNYNNTNLSFNYYQSKTNLKIIDIPQSINNYYIGSGKYNTLNIKSIDGLLIPNIEYVYKRDNLKDVTNYIDSIGNIKLSNFVRKGEYENYTGIISVIDDTEYLIEMDNNYYTIKIDNLLEINIQENIQFISFNYDGKLINYSINNDINKEHYLTIACHNNVFRIMIDDIYIFSYSKNLFLSAEFNNFNKVNVQKCTLIDDNFEEIDKTLNIIGTNNYNGIDNINFKINLDELQYKSNDNINYYIDGYLQNKVATYNSIITIKNNNELGYINNNNQTIIDNKININDIRNNNTVDTLLFFRRNNNVMNLKELNFNIYPVNWKIIDSNVVGGILNIDTKLSCDTASIVNNTIKLKQEEIITPENYDVMLSIDTQIFNIPISIYLNNELEDTINTEADGTLNYVFEGLHGEVHGDEFYQEYNIKIKILKEDLQELIDENIDYDLETEINLLLKMFSLNKHLGNIIVEPNILTNINNGIVTITDEYNVPMDCEIYEIIDDEPVQILYLDYINPTLINGEYTCRFNIPNGTFSSSGNKKLKITTKETTIGGVTYLSDSKEVDLVVEKYTPNNSIKIYKDNVEIDFNTYELHIDDTIKIVGETNAPNGTVVDLILCGNTKNVTVLDGYYEATFTITEYSDYSITGVINNTNVSNSITFNNNLNVISINTSINVSVSGQTYWGVNNTITATLKDNNGNNISNSNLSLYCNNSLMSYDSANKCYKITVTLNNNVGVTTAYNIKFNGSGKYRTSSNSKNITTTKRPVTISLGVSGTVYYTWLVKYTIKDAVASGTTVSTPSSVKISINGTKYTASYSNGVASYKMPKVNTTAINSTTSIKVSCEFTHSKYENVTTTATSINYQYCKKVIATAGTVANYETRTGGRCTWRYNDSFSSANLSKCNLASSTSSYLMCSNYDYPIRPSSAETYQKKPVQLIFTNWTNLTNLPSTATLINAELFIDVKNVNGYSGYKTTAKIGKCSISGSGGLSATGNAPQYKTDGTQAWTYVFNGYNLGLSLATLRSSFNLKVDFGANTGSYVGRLALCICRIDVYYIPKQ